MLDREVLEEARRISGVKTYSETVNKALAELVRQHKGPEHYRVFWERPLEGRFDRDARGSSPASRSTPEGTTVILRRCGSIS
jgi:Arc/MetJ family transcription regulator